jgi:hypothetical protein
MAHARGKAIKTMTQAKKIILQPLNQAKRLLQHH